MQNFLYKLACIPLLIAIACLFAGLFGVMHHQISFTVSPEYFFEFKFKQFAIAPDLQNRIGASFVGLRASWYMGLFIGPPIAFAGLSIVGTKTYFTKVTKAFALAIATAALFAIAGLAISYFIITPEFIAENAAENIAQNAVENTAENYTPNTAPNNGTKTAALHIPESVQNPIAFARAGMMHNAAYLGGFIGIFAALFYLIVVRVMQRGTAAKPKPLSL
jgi:hypothetical protein